MSEQPISIHYQQMEEWLDDRKSVFSRKYKKPYTELLSLAPRLVQMAQYDIPALEKQIKKNETAIEECFRVGEEAVLAQQKLSEKRAAMLAEYEIDEAEDGERGVLGAVDHRVDVACSALNTSFQAYVRVWVGPFKEVYNAHLERTAAGYFDGDAFALHFPWLQRAVEEADFVLPDSSLGDARNVELEDTGPQIDWGDEDGDLGGGAGEGVAADAAVQINWDADEMEARPAESESLPPRDGKHFSIDLSLAKHRISVLAELQAVLCFCRERGRVKELEACRPTEELFELLSVSRDAEFSRMRENYRSKDAFVDRIDRFEQQMMVAKNRRATHEAKMRDAEAELARVKPQYAELLAKTTSTRDSALACLTQMFPDRKILIVGDLNKYIS